MDFEFQILQSHPVLQIPIQAVGFLDEQDPAAGVVVQKRDHAGVVPAASVLGGFHVDELVQDAQVTVVTVMFSRSFVLRCVGMIVEAGVSSKRKPMP